MTPQNHAMNRYIIFHKYFNLINVHTYLRNLLQKSAVEVSNILYKNIKGTSASDIAIDFECSKSVPCHDIVLQDINLIKEGGGTAKSSCKNVEWTKMGQALPEPCDAN